MQLGICCSPQQHELALRLAARIERNFGVNTVIVADEHAPLRETWEQASASDAVLLLLDRRSAPGPVKREEWQSLLDHNGVPPVATLKLEPCAYPKLLERSRFLASKGNDLEDARWVELWLAGVVSAQAGSCESQGILRTDSPAPAAWWTKVVDAPGVLTLAPSDIDAVQTFASEAGAHFQGAVWMGCEGIPSEALIAQIEARIVDQGRLLFILVHAEPGIALPPGRHSFVLVEGRPMAAAAGGAVSEVEALISACRPSGFPAALFDWMFEAERRHEWESLVTPITADRQWFRQRRCVEPSGEACMRHFRTLLDVFRGWRRRPESCRELVGEAAWAIERHRVGVASELCLDLARFLLEEKRMAEGVAWLKILAASGDEQDEFAIQGREELRWQVDEFGSYRRPQPILAGEQDAFDFPGFFVAGPSAADQELLEELRGESAEQLQRPRPAGRQLQFELFP